MSKKLLLVGVLFSLLAVAGFAQVTDSASITLQGVVAPVVTVTVTPESGYNTLNLGTDQTDLLVATVNEFSNVAAGYTVTLTSVYAGANATADAGFSSLSTGDTLAYSVEYDGAAVAFSGGSATVTPAGTKSATAAGVDKAVTISYSGAAVVLGDGTYTDTLEFTITGN